MVYPSTHDLRNSYSARVLALLDTEREKHTILIVGTMEQKGVKHLRPMQCPFDISVLQNSRWVRLNGEFKESYIHIRVYVVDDGLPAKLMKKRDIKQWLAQNP